VRFFVRRFNEKLIEKWPSLIHHPDKSYPPARGQAAVTVDDLFFSIPSPSSRGTAISAI
jgi:hypothetical protein